MLAIDADAPKAAGVLNPKDDRILLEYLISDTLFLTTEDIINI
jgi:hypothetical protein